MRESYSLAGLAEADLAPDWVTQFRPWLADAVAAGIAEPNAMVVATASPDGEVASRTRAVQGRRRRRCRLLHQPDTRTRAATCRRTRGRRPPSRGSRCSGRCTSAARSSGCPTRRPQRVLGDPARAAPGSAPGPARSRPCCRTGPRWRRCRPRPTQRFGGGRTTTDADPVAAVLGRLADRAGDRRVLAGPVRPAARPAALPGQRVRRLGHRTTGPVSGHVEHRDPAEPDGPAGAGRTRRRPRSGRAARRRDREHRPTAGPGCAGSARTPGR